MFGDEAVTWSPIKSLVGEWLHVPKYVSQEKTFVTLLRRSLRVLFDAVINTLRVRKRASIVKMRPASSHRGPQLLVAIDLPPQEDQANIIQSKNPFGIVCHRATQLRGLFSPTPLSIFPQPSKEIPRKDCCCL